MADLNYPIELGRGVSATQRYFCKNSGV